MNSYLNIYFFKLSTYYSGYLHFCRRFFFICTSLSATDNVCNEFETIVCLFKDVDSGSRLAEFICSKMPAGIWLVGCFVELNLVCEMLSNSMNAN